MLDRFCSKTFLDQPQRKNKGGLRRTNIVGLLNKRAESYVKKLPQNRVYQIFTFFFEREFPNTINNGYKLESIWILVFLICCLIIFSSETEIGIEGWWKNICFEKGFLVDIFTFFKHWRNDSFWFQDKMFLHKLPQITRPIPITVFEGGQQV